MAEWLIAPVLKTGIVRNKELSRVRIPLSPLSRRINLFIFLVSIESFFFRLKLRKKEKKFLFKYDPLNSTQYL